MKKIRYFSLCLLFLCIFSGCDQENSEFYLDSSLLQESGNVPAIDDSPIEDETSFLPDENTILSTTEGIDIDLTQLSASMVYSLVFNMIFFPEEYVGKTIRMEGEFFVYHNPVTNRDYYATVVEDALACCQQGLQFILAEGEFPGDYPSIESEIVVTGVLETYVEDGAENIQLIQAEWYPAS